MRNNSMVYIFMITLFVLSGCVGIRKISVPENYVDSLPKSKLIDVPLIGQYDNYSCATTALAMVMSYYDNTIYPKNEVWDRSGASIHEATKVCGNDMHALKKAATSYGFHNHEFVSPLKLEELKYLISKNIPVIVNIKTYQCNTCYHAVVITGYDEELLFINDPKGHKARMPISQFKKNWKAHLCTPRRDMFSNSAFILYSKAPLTR